LITSCLPRIPTSAFKQIISKLKRTTTQESSSSSSKVKSSKSKPQQEKTTTTPKSPAKPRIAKDFEHQVMDSEKTEYNNLVARIQNRIGRLSVPKVVSYLNNYALSDSLSGAICKYFAFSIPVAKVGQLRAENKRATAQHFLGSFASEISMFTFLLKELQLPRDNPLVLQTAEYYGINISTSGKYSDRTIDDHYNSILLSRTCDGNGSPYQPLQLGRSPKAIKKAFFYRVGEDTSNYDQTKNYIDCSSLRHLYKLDASECSFNDHSDFLLDDQKFRAKKAQSLLAKEAWSKHLSLVGIERGLEDFELLQKKHKLDSEIISVYPPRILNSSEEEQEQETKISSKKKRGTETRPATPIPSKKQKQEAAKEHENFLKEHENDSSTASSDTMIADEQSQAKLISAVNHHFNFARDLYSSNEDDDEEEEEEEEESQSDNE